MNTKPQKVSDIRVIEILDNFVNLDLKDDFRKAESYNTHVAQIYHCFKF